MHLTPDTTICRLWCHGRFSKNLTEFRVRNNEYHLKFIKSRSEDTGDARWKDGFASNFLLEENGRYTILLNQDKVSANPLYGKAEFPLPAELCADITESLLMYPREYLFTSKTGKEMDKKGFSRLLAGIIPGKELGIDNLRSSYITWFHGKYHDIQRRTELARQMRHSLFEAERSYHKVSAEGRSLGADPAQTVPAPAPVQATPAEAPERLPAEYDAIRKRKRDLEKKWKQENIASVGKSNARYYEKNRKEINRASRLADYNRGTDGIRAVPSRKTIEKYSLQMGEDGLWF